MKKCLKKAVSGILAAAMLCSSVVFAPMSASAAAMTAGGWYETIYAEISCVTDDDVTAVSYSGTASGSLSGDDLTYLVRDDDSGVRIDIPGLAAGTYTLTVTAGGATYTQSDITVYEYDRSGYAHYDADKDTDSSSADGIGAYNDDGTLKDNAIVMYVTEENKNTVQVPGYTGDSYPVGIGNILNYKSEDAGSITGDGRTDVLKELRANDIPLDIRFVGTIEGGTTTTRGSNAPDVNILGLTAYDSTTNGGTSGDNGMMARIYKSSNITFEGIGTDATIAGWGFQVISQTGYVSEGFEFRNLTFTETPEDAIGLEGTASLSTSPQSKEWLDESNTPIKYCWVHNNTFEQGYCATPAESDKAEGDGSVDWKRGYGYTMSYNHYVENHKTNLIGSSKQSIQYDATLHHNYYEGVMSRQPLARQANIHIYNSYFENGDDTSYIISPRAYSYIFTEANYFDGCKNPVNTASEGGDPVVKSYNDNFAGCTGNNIATIVDSYDTAVSNSNPYTGFELSDDMYEYTATSAVQAKADCVALAGVMKEASEIDMDPDPISIITTYPSTVLSLPYEINFTDSADDNYWTTKTNATSLTAGTTYDMDGALVTPYAKVSSTGTYIKIRDDGVVFAVNTNVNVTIDTGSSSAYGAVLYNEYGEAVLTIVSGGGSGTVTNLDAGIYVLKSGNVAKDAYINSILIEAYDATATTVEYTTVEATTQITTEGSETTTSSSEATTSSDDSGDEEETEETTSAPYTGEGLVWDYTSGTNTLGADVDANDWTSAVSVSYGGTTLTQAVKMESDSSISFTVTGSGTLTLVTYSTKASPTVVINDETVSVSTNGAATYDITSTGTYTITKGTASTYIYLLEFVGTTTTTTETTTETTTTTTTAETTTETTTDEDSGDNDSIVISVGDASGVVDGTVTVPVYITGASSIANYDITLSYDSDVLTATGVTNGDVLTLEDDILTYNISTAGVVNISATNVEDINTSGDNVLCYVTFTAVSSGEAAITLTVNELGIAASDSVSYTADNGIVTVAASETTTETTTESPGSSSDKGDVDNDGDIDEIDAAIVLNIASGLYDESYVAEKGWIYDNADYDGDGDITVLDVVGILNYDGSETTTEATTSSEYAATLNAESFEVATYSESFSSGGFTVMANSSNTVQVDSNSKTVDDYSFTRRIKLGGGGTVEYRSIKFTAAEAGNIDVYAMSSSSSEDGDRVMQLLDANGNQKATVDISYSASLSKYTFTLPGAGTYYICSTSGGLNIYFIGSYVELESDTTTTESTTEATTTTTEADTETTTESSEAVLSWSASSGSTDLGNFVTTTDTSLSTGSNSLKFEDSSAFSYAVKISGGETITVSPNVAGTVKVYMVRNNTSSGCNATVVIKDSGGETVSTETATVSARADGAAVLSYTLEEGQTLSITPASEVVLYAVNVY